MLQENTEGSLTRTLVRSTLPVLLTTRVEEMGAPAATVGVSAVLVRAILGTSNVTTAVDWAISVFESALAVATAVFVSTCPPVGGFATIATVEVH